MIVDTDAYGIDTDFLFSFFHSPKQINVINKNIKLAANFLKRCPSCFHNLVEHICDFSCSPNQSNFMKIHGTEKGDKGKFLNYSLAHDRERKRGKTVHYIKYLRNYFRKFSRPHPF